MRDKVKISLLDDRYNKIGRIELPSVSNDNLIKIINLILNTAVEDAWGLSSYSVASSETRYPEEEGF